MSRNKKGFVTLKLNFADDFKETLSRLNKFGKAHKMDIGEVVTFFLKIHMRTSKERYPFVDWKDLLFTTKEERAFRRNKKYLERKMKTNEQ